MAREAKFDEAAETFLDKWETAMKASMDEAERLKKPVPDLYWSMHELHGDLLALVASRHVLQAIPTISGPGHIGGGYNSHKESPAVRTSKRPSIPAPVVDDSGVPQSVFVPAVEVPLPAHLASLLPTKPKTARPLHFLQKLRLAGESMGEPEANMLRHTMKVARDAKWSKKTWLTWVESWEKEHCVGLPDGEAKTEMLARANVARAIKPILAKDAADAPVQVAAQ